MLIDKEKSMVYSCKRGVLMTKIKINEKKYINHNLFYNKNYKLDAN